MRDHAEGYEDGGATLGEVVVSLSLNATLLPAFENPFIRHDLSLGLLQR